MLHFSNRFTRKNVNLFELLITLKHARNNLRTYDNKKVHYNARINLRAYEYSM